MPDARGENGCYPPIPWGAPLGLIWIADRDEVPVCKRSQSERENVLGIHDCHTNFSGFRQIDPVDEMDGLDPSLR